MKAICPVEQTSSVWSVSRCKQMRSFPGVCCLAQVCCSLIGSQLSAVLILIKYVGSSLSQLRRSRRAGGRISAKDQIISHQQPTRSNFGPCFYGNITPCYHYGMKKPCTWKGASNLVIFTHRAFFLYVSEIYITCMYIYAAVADSKTNTLLKEKVSILLWKNTFNYK